jgi:hypothetical protein
MVDPLNHFDRDTRTQHRVHASARSPTTTFFSLTDIDDDINIVCEKCRPVTSANLPPALTPSKRVTNAQGYFTE